MHGQYPRYGPIGSRTAHRTRGGNCAQCSQKRRPENRDRTAQLARSGAPRRRSPVLVARGSRCIGIRECRDGFRCRTRRTDHAVAMRFRAHLRSQHRRNQPLAGRTHALGRYREGRTTDAQRTRTPGETLRRQSRPRARGAGCARMARGRGPGRAYAGDPVPGWIMRARR